MTAHGFRIRLWSIIAVGVLVTAAIAAVTHGDPFDMQSFRLVRDALFDGPWKAYTAHQAYARWPYPPGLFPWIYVAGTVAKHSALSFEFLMRVPPILADAALAWLVQDFLRWRGGTQRTRLVAAALISLGPSFLFISGYHGQFDALAILPGVAAVAAWERSDASSRALTAGLLIGAGGALKTYPLLLVLALLPTAGTRREAAVLLGAAATPVLLAFLPYAIAGALPSRHVLFYRGVPGAGGLSLLAQPGVSVPELGIGPGHLSPLIRWASDHSAFFIGTGLLAVAAVGARTRARALPMAVLLWLALYAFGVNFFFQYVLWGLPFFLMAGYVREVALVELTLVIPAGIFYLRPWHHVAVAVLYTTTMLGLLAVAIVAFALTARRMLALRARPAQA